MTGRIQYSAHETPPDAMAAVLAELAVRYGVSLASAQAS